MKCTSVDAQVADLCGFPFRCNSPTAMKDPLTPQSYFCKAGAGGGGEAPQLESE